MDRVRQALPSDRMAVTTTVAAAFAHDPAWSFLCGADYDRLAPNFARALFDTRVDSGNVWIVDDVSAVAMWDPPGSSPSPESEQLWQAYRGLAGESAWKRLSDYESALDAVRPSTPYWYLGVLATHPERQNHGLATAVMTPILERADGGGLDCCLETSTISNRQFYGHRGFTDTTDVHVASGPPTWWLRRAPRQAPGDLSSRS